jgi:hypothetical protein
MPIVSAVSRPERSAAHLLPAGGGRQWGRAAHVYRVAEPLGFGGAVGARRRIGELGAFRFNLNVSRHGVQGGERGTGDWSTTSAWRGVSV